MPTPRTVTESLTHRVDLIIVIETCCLYALYTKNYILIVLLK